MMAHTCNLDYSREEVGGSRTEAGSGLRHPI
jgi:hypothetical protein